MLLEWTTIPAGAEWKPIALWRKSVVLSKAVNPITCADGLSANAANSPDVRRTLRNRSRYERANNSYARGIVLMLANDVIGTGPRLLTDNPVANRRIEAAFAQWARRVNLPAKLRTTKWRG